MNRALPIKAFFLGLAGVFISISFFVAPQAHAALYNASGLLGHIDGNGNPIYTVSNINDAPNAQGFHSPQGAALDSLNHRLFVADSRNNRVLVFMLNANDTLATTTASYVLGQQNFVSSSSATTRSGLNDPTGLAYDPVAQRLFVAEDDNNRVTVFDVNPSTVTNGEDAENVLGQTNFTSSTATTTASGFRVVSYVAYDASSSRLFAADSNNSRVLIFDVATSTITNGEDAENVLGQADFTSADYDITTSTVSTPIGVGFDPITQRLFVADSGGARVMIFDVATSTITNGEDAENVLGQADFSSSDYLTSTSSVADPWGLTFDPITQRLFVADADLSRVMVFDAATSTITNGEDAENVLGQPDFSSDNFGTTQSTIPNSEDVAYDPISHNLFVVDAGGRVMVFDAATSTIANGENASGLLGQVDQSGNPMYTASADNNSSIVHGFNTPKGVALDPLNHRLFIADVKNNRVVVFPLGSNNDLGATTPSFVLGQSNFTSSNSATTKSGFSFSLFTGAALAYDPSYERLFVADYGNNRVLVFNVATSTIANGENANYVLGQADFTSSVATTTKSGLLLPDGLTYDSVNQRLFVADSNNSRVLVFNVATSTIANGENANYVLGQADFTSRVATTTQSGFHTPEDLAYDPLNYRLFVSDGNGNSRVMVFNVATSTIMNGEDAENVLGQANFTSVVGTTTQNRLLLPIGLAYDPNSQYLFVAGSNNSRVMVFDVATSTIADGEDAENVLGETNFTSESYVTTQNGLNRPNYLAYDSSGHKLFIADSSNNRVLQYSFIKLATTSLSDGTSGSAYSAPITTTSSQGTVSYTLASGSLPDGLTFSTSTGVISGTPTIATSSSFTIEADDTFSTGKFFDQEPFTLTIDAPAPTPPAPAAIVIVPIPVDQAPPVITPPPSTVPPVTSSSSASSSSAPSVASLQSTLANLEARLQSLIALAQEQGISVNASSASGSSVTPSFPRNLSLWMTGSDVHALQVFLNTHGYPVASSGNGSEGHETQTFGPKTMQALIQFQKDHNIPATGFFGPMTRGEIAGE